MLNQENISFLMPNFVLEYPLFSPYFKYLGNKVENYIVFGPGSKESQQATQHSFSLL